MAGTSPGAPAPSYSNPIPTPARSLRLVPASTRTRRNHGVFLLGNELATVYSTRRESGGLGVTLSVGNGSLMLTGGMTPTQARAMARALAAAADATEATRPAQAAVTALPGRWREAESGAVLVRLNVPAVTPGMVAVAIDGTDWQSRPELRFQAWPADLVEG